MLVYAVNRILCLVGCAYGSLALFAQTGQGDLMSEWPEELKAGGEVGLVILITNVVKNVLPDTDFSHKLLPLIAIIVGVLIGLVTMPTWKEGIYRGIVIAAAASGIYGWGKSTKKKHQK